MLAQDLKSPEWLSGLQRPPSHLPRDADRPAPMLFDGTNQPITDRAGWERRREELHRAWLRILGEIPTTHAVAALDVIEENDADGGAISRQLVRYEAEPGLPVEGYLLRPAGDVLVSRPGVAVFHSTVDSTIRQPAGLEGPPDKHIGLHLARRGYVAFCPRNFLWQYGEPGNLASAVDWLRARHPGLTGMAKMLHDARRAIDVLTGLPGVDASRLGAIGHSLGAKEVLYLAAFDVRVRAAVASEGGIGIAYSNWEAPWYLGDQIKRAGFGLDHAQLLALAAPRAFLLIGGDSADGARSWPYVEAVRPVWALLGADSAVGLLNHEQGHEYPDAAKELAGCWLD